jgi:Domain of unknown function (DUF4032)
VRFVFRPPATETAGLLTLPWDRPLATWPDDVLADVPQRRISRHVVRYVALEGTVYALKEIVEPLARKEYALLADFGADGLPTVGVVGICVDRPGDQPAILITRYLDYSVSYRHLFSTPRGDVSAEQLIDTLVALLVRLHLDGVFWGDCSLSNALFLPDAGTVAAYVVDAQTAERHASLSPDQRLQDVDIAIGRVAAELLDLEAAGLLPADVDAVELAVGIRPKYDALWTELTREEVVLDDPASGVTGRVQRLSDLGFDVQEIELVTSGAQAVVRVRTQVAGPDAHRRELFRLSGLEVQENQARRLLDDLRGYRAWLEQRDGAELPDTVAGHRWVAEVYQPVVDAIPAHLLGRLAPAEVFHEILEHRWFLSEIEGEDVGTTTAARSYFDTVLGETTREPGVPSIGSGLHQPTAADGRR